MKQTLRHRSRRCALQGLYQWQLTDNSPLNIQQNFLQNNEYGKIDNDYFVDCLTGTIAHIATIDKEIALNIDRSITELSPVELAILRLAVYELLHHSEIPYRVVVNEAIELAKTFGAQDGYKYVNGVLDKIASRLRSFEQC